MRVLFVVPPLAGHVNPTVAVAAELTARGHEVAWTGPAAALTPLLPTGSTLYAAGDRDAAADRSWAVRDGAICRASPPCASSGRRPSSRSPARCCPACTPPSKPSGPTSW